MDGKKSKGRPRRMWIDDIKASTNVGEYGQLKGRHSVENSGDP